MRLEEADERLPDLIRWMGFNPQSGLSMSVDNLAKKERHHWTEWTTDEHAAFDKWCGPVMDRHYPGWREVVGADSARIFVAPVIRSLARQAEDARVHRMRLQARLRGIEGHWSYKWYCRFRRLLGSSSGMTE